MPLITQHDFETKTGQEKIARTIHSLEQKIDAMEQKLFDLTQKECALERDVAGYGVSER